MRNITELEAAQALGEIARQRRRAGLPGLDLVEAALLLRGLREIRSLPETGSPVPLPRPGRAFRTSWLSNQ